MELQGSKLKILQVKVTTPPPPLIPKGVSIHCACVHLVWMFVSIASTKIRIMLSNLYITCGVLSTRKFCDMKLMPIVRELFSRAKKVCVPVLQKYCVVLWFVSFRSWHICKSEPFVNFMNISCMKVPGFYSSRHAIVMVNIFIWLRVGGFDNTIFIMKYTEIYHSDPQSVINVMVVFRSVC